MSKKLFFAGELLDTATLQDKQIIKNIELEHEMNLSSPFIYTSKYSCSVEVISDDEYKLIGFHWVGTLCRTAPPYVVFRDAKIFLDVDDPDWDELWYPFYRNYVDALSIEDFIDQYIATAEKAGATPIEDISIEIESNRVTLTLKF
ncbi:MAG: hypothetical protein SNF93_06910 [Rikenellaceae bacterium]